MKNLKIFWSLVAASIILFGFQNCGSQQQGRDSFVINQSASTLNQQDSISDTSYSFSQSFKLIQREAQSDLTDFEVKNNEESNSFEVLKENTTLLCEKENNSPLMDLTLLAEHIRVTHPDSLNLEVCTNNLSKGKHIKLGDGPLALFLILMDIENNCITDAAQDLIAEGKRVFVVSNLEEKEIDALIAEAKDSVKDSKCEKAQQYISAR